MGLFSKPKVYDLSPVSDEQRLISDLKRCIPKQSKTIISSGEA